MSEYCLTHKGRAVLEEFRRLLRLHGVERFHQLPPEAQRAMDEYAERWPEVDLR